MDQQETEPETKPEPQALTDEELAAVTGGKTGNHVGQDDWKSSGTS